MALIPIGPWKRDSTYRVHPLGPKDYTYRVPLLDSKLVRLRYAWYYCIKSPSGHSSALTVLGMPQPSFGTLNTVEPRLTYPNLYIDHNTPYRVLRLTSVVRHGVVLAIVQVVSFPDPAFKLDKGLAHFARNLGLADSALPEIWRTNQIAFNC